MPTTVHVLEVITDWDSREIIAAAFDLPDLEDKATEHAVTNGLSRYTNYAITEVPLIAAAPPPEEHRPRC